MEQIVVIEKRRKIGELDGENIFVWELYDVMRHSQLDIWCRERGYTTPYLSNLVNRNVVYSNLEATLWDVGERA